MADIGIPVVDTGDKPGEKGLRGATLGLMASVVIGVASTAPGYSLVHRCPVPVLVVPDPEE